MKKWLMMAGMLAATCAFARADIPKRRDVRFVVCPIDCWGKKGTPIASPWRRFAVST